MANTEGMPDEVLESLLGNPSSTLAQSTTNRSTSISARQQRLQKRMDMPIGGRPAATVIRPSSKSHSLNSSENYNAEEDAFAQSESKNTSSTPPPIVGSIVERPPVFGTTGATTPNMGKSNQKMSRFAQQQKVSSSSASKVLSSSLNINGFPSVNVPLGTFVNKRVARNTTKQHEETTASSQKVSSMSSTKNVDYLAHIHQEPGTTPRPSASADDIQANDGGIKGDMRGNELSQLLDESERQAHAMLSQMSEIEINESVKELESSIPPELQLFLKQRGAAKRKQQQTQQSRTLVSTQQQSYPLQETLQAEWDEAAEKKRLADLVSSIKTHEELDVAYQAEQKQDHVTSDQEPLQCDEKLDAGVGKQAGEDSDDFALACSLLRSTVPRQRLWGARTVSLRLQRDFEQHVKRFRNGKWKGISNRYWPIVLPVSLRCLLDQPPHHSNSGYLVHTYVLQSIYYLLALTVHPDHVVSIDDWSRSPPMANTCFQSFYMDDAVPTPLLRDCYQSTQPMKPLTVGSGEEARKGGAHSGDNNHNEAVAYATSSSSSSAQVDGDAFERDPMWTLLSRMRILPRMAQLLDLSSSYSQWQQDPKQDDPSTCSRLPQEALVAIAGILAILCQRSPGAASAIIHHQTLLQQLLNSTLLRLVRLQNDEEDNDDLGEKEHMKSAMISVALLCTLARQSRVAAAKLLPLVVDEIIPAILSRSIALKSCEMRLLQQWVLILWRTLLRFGLGLSNLSTIISLGAPHLALNHGSESLAPFFLSALTQVLECVRFAKRKSIEEVRDRIPGEDMEILSMAGAWLASSKQSVMTRLSLYEFQVPRATDANLKEEIRSCAMDLRFLSSFYTLTIDFQDQSKDEIKIENLLADDAHVWLETMAEWMGVGGAIDRSWSLISPYVVCEHREEFKDVISSPNLREPGGCFDLELEASVCAFLDSTVSALLTLENAGTQLEEIRDRSKFAVEKFLSIILDGMRGATLLPLHSEQYGGGYIEEPPYAQQGWINQCLFAISKLLFHGMSVGILNSSSDVSLVRMFVFSLLGRLQIGNESMAAVLYSQDGLFTAISDPILENVDVYFKSSPMSNMFMEELCGSKIARQQLDHSFKLQHGFGITPDGFGAFRLHSLRSDSDQVPKEGSSSSSDFVLPLGRLWLWQTLSGSIQPTGESLNAGTREASSVVSACLKLILAVEEDEDLLNPNNDATCHRTGYAGRIPLGARLYYIMNICLHPEAVLREDNVVSPAEAVLDIYLRRLESISVEDFATACLHHTNPAKKERAETDQHEDIELNENEKKTASLFHPELSTSGASDYSNLTSKQMRALVAFLEDLTSAYTDYGAQYSFFTKCMRIFLLPIFPSPLRCHVLRELRGMLHILTLPHEFDDPSGTDMRTLVEQSVSVGCDEGIQIVRDPSDILDLAISILGAGTSAGGGNQRTLQGYALPYALAIVIRNIASTCPWQQTSSDTTVSSAREACKKRLLRLEVALVKILLDSSIQFLSSNGKKGDLVNVVMNCATLYPMALAKGNHERIDENSLHRMLDEADEAHMSNKRTK